MLMSLIVLGFCNAGLADEPIHDPIHDPLPPDVSFDSYVDLQLIADSLRAGDAKAVADQSIQFAEAERILLRRHNSDVTSATLFVQAARLAAINRDDDTLTRLSEYAEKSGTPELVDSINAARKLAAVSRVAPAEFSVSLQTAHIDNLISIKEWLNCIKTLEHTGDAQSLIAVREAVDGATHLSESQKAALISQIDGSIDAVGPSDLNGLLQKLASTGRGWDPRKTVGKIADGDIVGAISGADFRIPSNSTGFTGSSARHWIMVYTLKNDTPYSMTIEFVRSGNISSLAPGRTITCRSRASSRGSEKTGVEYTYPQIRAKASNGKAWLRTISRDGEDYRVIRRSDSSIQIVP